MIVADVYLVAQYGDALSSLRGILGPDRHSPPSLKGGSIQYIEKICSGCNHVDSVLGEIHGDAIGRVGHTYGVLYGVVVGVYLDYLIGLSISNENSLIGIDRCRKITLFVRADRYGASAWWDANDPPWPIRGDKDILPQGPEQCRLVKNVYEAEVSVTGGVNSANTIVSKISNIDILTRGGQSERLGPYRYQIGAGRSSWVYRRYTVVIAIGHIKPTRARVEDQPVSIPGLA